MHSGEKFLKIKNRSILLILFVTIVIIIQILISIFLGINSITSFNNAKKNELKLVWDKYIDTKFTFLSNFVDGYSNWTDVAEKIKNDTLDEDTIVSWKSGNSNKNDLSSIIVGDTSLVKDGIDVDKLEFVFNEDIIKKIYQKTDMNRDSRNNNYILIKNDIILLLKASAICDDLGEPYTNGIEIFGKILKEGDIKDAESFLNSDIKINNTVDKKIFTHIKIVDSFNDTFFRYIEITPKENLFSLVFFPLAFTLIMQILITLAIIITFLFLISAITKLYNNLSSQTDNFVNLFNDVDFFSSNIISLQNFFKDFNTILNSLEGDLYHIKEQIVLIDNKSKSEDAKIDKVNLTINSIVENINAIGSHIEDNYKNIKTDEKTIEKLNENMEDIKNISEKTKEISDQLNNYTFDAEEVISSAINSINDVEKASNSILEISDVISNIAEKTNLLSINASIESAHSGTYGKGFAVVAQEIRKLSNNTNKKAKDIIEAIKIISNKIYIAVNLSKEGSNKLKEALNLSFDNKESVESLNNSMDDQTNIVQDVIISTRLIFSIVEEINNQLKTQQSFSQELILTMNELKTFSKESREIFLNHFEVINNLINNIPKLKEANENGSKLVDKFNNFFI
ncbi:MAG TPA: methyl-accepting chemotaxis protein, partial [Spirochaetota bacterium]|nr:methyl-accepting chemotaxis protein [Spirochaetota bacterium]